MKKYIVFLCSMLLVLVVFSISDVQATLITSNILDNPTVIDFSQFSSANYYGVSGPVQVGDLVSADVTITADPFESNKGLWLYNGNWLLGDNGYWDNGMNGFAGYWQGPGSIIFSFNDGPISGVGAFINDIEEGHEGIVSDFIISVYNTDMLLLESYNIYDLAPINTPGGANDGAFRGIIRNTADISHFAISGYSFVADDLAFATSAPVPEPATMLLLGTGLVGLAGVGRKKFFKKK